MVATERDLYELLDRLGVAWTLSEHEPVFTVAESRSLRERPAGVHTKNLFLTDKSGAPWLVACRDDRRMRIGALARALGARKLSFGSAERLRATLGVEPGSVTPFALINDRARAVRLALDAQMLLADEPICFHPLRNDATIGVSAAGLLSFLEALGHAPVMLDCDALELAAGGQG